MSNILPINRDKRVFKNAASESKNIVIHILGKIDPDKTPHLIPLMISKVPAGFPSPADDYIEDRLSLDSMFLENPTATFLVKAQGDSMIGANIQDNSLLIVDRSATPSNGDVVVVSINGEHTVKKFKKNPDGKVFLCPENDKYAVIELKEELENILWGVVKYVIHPPK